MKKDKRLEHYEELVTMTKKLMKDIGNTYGDALSIGDLSDDDLKILRDTAALYKKAMEVSREQMEMMVAIDEKLDILIEMHKD